MEIIEKKFPRNSTAFDLSEHDFLIEKRKGKSPTFDFFHCKCDSSDNYKAKLRSFDKKKSSRENLYG